MTNLSDSHFGAPTDATERNEGRNEASIHLIQKHVRTLDIDQGLMRLIKLIDVEELVEATRDDLATLLIEDNTTALSIESRKREEKRVRFWNRK